MPLRDLEHQARVLMRFYKYLTAPARAGVARLAPGNKS